MKKKLIGIRISPELYQALKAIKGPYAPTMTQIVERGIELALRELKNVSAGRKAK